MERERWFRINPVCAMCGLAEATELDHIIALVNGGSDVASNKQGLCSPCHEKKTALDLGYIKRERTGDDGYPIVEP